MTIDKKVKAITEFLNVTNGREKLCQFVQYFARFYAHYLTRQKAQTLEIQSWTSLQKNLAIGRGFFRLFKTIELTQSFVKSLAIEDSVLRYTQSIKFFSNLFHFMFESMGLLDNVDFIKFKNIRKINELRLKFWFVSLTASALSSIYRLQQQPMDKKVIMYQLEQDLLNMVIPMGSLKWIPLNEYEISMAGMITSAMAINSQWKKSNAL